MKRSTNCSVQQSTSSRCTYLSAGGGRCRMFASPDSPYCRSHAKNSIVLVSTLAAELSQAAGSLAAPEDVNRVLAKIFLALAADRLSTRKAAVLGYIAQMLLRSHREIAFHKKLAVDEAERNEPYELLSRNVPRADRDANGNASRKQIIVDIDGTIHGPGTPAVIAPSQPPASSSNLECGGSFTQSLEGAPLSQPPAPRANHNSTPPAVPAPQTAPAPQQTPEVADSSPDPSQPNPPLADLNHFYPRDPSLPPSLQQPRNTTSPPDAEEQRWRELSRRYAPARRRMQ